MFSPGQSVRPEPGRGRRAFCRPIRFFLELAPHIRVKNRPPPSLAVPRYPPPSSAVFRRPLPSPTRICLRSWGLLSFLITAVLEIQVRGWRAFCRLVLSLALGSPPPGPYGGLGRLRTLALLFIIDCGLVFAAVRSPCRAWWGITKSPGRRSLEKMRSPTI